MGSGQRRPAWVAPLGYALLLVLLAGSTSGLAPYKEQRKACPAGCTKFGTCYEPLGRWDRQSPARAAQTERDLGSNAGLHWVRRRCDCPWNYTGPACDQPFKGFCVKRQEAFDHFLNTCTSGEPTLCVNACNGRGKCMGGFCHCQPGEDTQVCLAAPQHGLLA